MNEILRAIALPIVAVLALVFVAWVIYDRGRAVVREWWTGVNRYEHLAEKLFSTAHQIEVPPTVRARVAQDFPKPDQSEVIDLLSRYGADSTPEGRQRVLLAIIDLSDGNKTLVRENLLAALLDYRDVLYAHETKFPGPERA